MTLSLRNNILLAAFLVLAAFAGLWIYGAWTMTVQQGLSARVGSTTLLWIVISSGAALAMSVAGFVIARGHFRKTNAPELFFLALFLSTLAGESLVLAVAWVHLQGASSWYLALLTRSVWGFRLTGLAFLLCSSLFSFEFSYRKYGNLVSLSIAAGWATAVALPIHEPSRRGFLFWTLGDTSSVGLVLGVLALVVSTNFLLGLRQPQEDVARKVSRTVAALVLTATWVLTLWFGPWVSLLSLPSLILLGRHTESSTYGP